MNTNNTNQGQLTPQRVYAQAPVGIAVNTAIRPAMVNQNQVVFANVNRPSKHSILHSTSLKILSSKKCVSV